jgi:hypothetical protein
MRLVEAWDHFTITGPGFLRNKDERGLSMGYELYILNETVEYVGRRRSYDDRYEYVVWKSRAESLV